MHFHIFILFRFLCNKRCSRVIFCVLDEKPTHKHVLRRQMTEIGNLTSWPQMTLTSEKFTSGSPQTMFRYVTYPNHVDSSAAYAFTSGILRRKGITWKCQTFCVWPDLWRHRWPRGQILNFIRTISSRSFHCRLNFSTTSVGFWDRWGPLPAPFHFPFTTQRPPLPWRHPGPVARFLYPIQYNAILLKVTEV